MEYESLIEETRKLDFPKRIKKLIAIAENIGASRRIFRSKKYKYFFNKCVTMDEIRKFENEKNIILPDSFVRFITEVSDGLTSTVHSKIPFARNIIAPKIWTLEDLYLETVPCNSEITIFDTNCKELWSSITKKIQESDDDEFLEKQYSILHNGLIFIGNGGCQSEYGLICKGSEYGKVAIFNLDHIPEIYPEIIADSFEEWIENFFIDTIMRSRFSG